MPRGTPRPQVSQAKQRQRTGVVWCGVVWCGVVWCGVVWCGVVWLFVVFRRCSCAPPLRRSVVRRSVALLFVLGAVWCVAVIDFVLFRQRFRARGVWWRYRRRCVRGIVAKLLISQWIR